MDTILPLNKTAHATLLHNTLRFPAAGNMPQAEYLPTILLSGRDRGICMILAAGDRQ
jgi:hypothetical protein|tara:strand:- start:662 stop:832 length:171 start_codon:yes stop_codon:yes gene_type:complete